MKNNTAQQVFECRPFEFVPSIPESALASKRAFTEWRNHPATEHLVYSLSEPLNPAIRVSKNNPLRKLHGICADFDAHITDENCRTVLDRCPVDLRPTWLSRTFSGGVRLIYEFENPIPLEIGDLAKQFLKIAFSELRIKKIFPGIDDSAFFDLSKYYDCGKNWQKLGDNEIATSILHLWLVEASRKVSWSNFNEIHIPIERIAEEVEKQYPGRWKGPFEVGARGVTFFRPDATNPTSAIITEAGVITFSSDKLFYSWSEILGANFVKKFQADRIGAAVEGVWFDGNMYYRKINGAYHHMAKEDFVKYLCAVKGLSRIPAKDGVSETMRAEVFVQEHRRVDGLIPRLFDPRDTIEYGGKIYLNCARVKCIQPAEERQEWGVNFPWLAKFFEMRFSPFERDVQFAWWKRFYCSALAGDLLKGQTLFIVGDVEIGKTLYAHKIIGASVGGSADASAHITKGSEFNKELFEVALRCIDDGEVASDAAAHRRFSEAVKRQAANPTMAYRAMYRDAQSITYNGRLLVTLNDDAYSLQMIPDLEMSMEEKVIVLKFRGKKGDYNFPPKYVLEPTIEAELPFLLRWLCDWKVPDEIVGGNRFGVCSYINEELRGKALNSGQAGDLLELIDTWIKRCDPARRGNVWKGSATEWIAEVSSQDDALGRLLSKFTVRQIGKKFMEATRIRGSRISIGGKDDRRGNIYEIHLNGDEDPELEISEFAGEEADSL